MKQFDIVVLGGGIYGLYTALFLSQREVTVAVIDIDQNFFSRASMVNKPASTMALITQEDKKQ